MRTQPGGNVTEGKSCDETHECVCVSLVCGECVYACACVLKDVR